MNTKKKMLNSVRIDLNRTQVEKLLGGKCVWKNVGDTTYSIKIGTTPENMKQEVRILQGQVYNYRAETKKLREFVASVGYNPSDVTNTAFEKLSTIKKKKIKK